MILSLFHCVCVGRCSYIHICTIREPIFHHAYNACAFFFIYCMCFFLLFGSKLQYYLFIYSNNKYSYSVSWESFHWSHSNRNRLFTSVQNKYVYYIHYIQRTWTSHTEHLSIFHSNVQSWSFINETVFFFPFCNLNI